MRNFAAISCILLVGCATPASKYQLASKQLIQRAGESESHCWVRASQLSRYSGCPDLEAAHDLATCRQDLATLSVKVPRMHEAKKKLLACMASKDWQRTVWIVVTD